MNYKVRTALRLPIGFANTIDAEVTENNIKSRIAKIQSLTDKYELITTKSNRVVLDYIIFEEETNLVLYNKIRKLYKSEKERLYGIFKCIVPNVDMNDVRLVKVTYLDGNMPDVADYNIDSFYEEIY